jgi:rubrerythrin
VKETMKKMTEANLKSAFAGESQANTKYNIFAEKAKKEGYPNIARLFTAAAFSEQVHASNHNRMLYGPKSTSENLQVGIDGESFEIAEMYPAYKAVAVAQGERTAETTIDWAFEAEKVHVCLYQKAKQAVDESKDVEMGPINVCQVCGYTVDGEAPDKCPICNARKDRFKAF